MWGDTHNFSICVIAETDVVRCPKKKIKCGKVIYVVKVVLHVLEGYRRCPDSHDLSECPHLYDLGRHI